MIKASKFSLQAGLFEDLGGKFSAPAQQNGKEQLNFLKGDPTYYGNVDVKMPQAGYDIVKKSILNPKNHSYAASNGSLAARNAIAKHFGGSNMAITGNDVILTHGANMGLFISLMSITNSGDNILVPEPGYPFFHKNGPSVGVEARSYKLNPEKGYQIDLEHLATLVDEKTRFLWVVNPSNPFGSIFTKEHIEEIFAFCRKHKLFIISDEVYWNESFSDYEFISLGHATTDVPVIVIGGMEKTFLVPGWGISWMIFFDQNQKLKEVKGACLTTCQLCLHPCSFLMSALPELLDTLTADFTKNFMKTFEENYNYLYEEFSNIKGLKPIPAQGTFYISVLIDLNQFKNFKNDVDFLQALNEEENIQILPLSVFKGDAQGFRMMSCATKKIYESFIPRLVEFCQRHIESK
ncbi:hypothetical protein ABPG74_021195 [Tetrahymena malaccensis]